MEIYNRYRAVPKEAQKTINAGRLKGMTDINPMWRIQSLTEAFGPCGVGWYVEIINQWIDSGSGGEAVANVKAALRVKIDGEWSAPVVGIGGSMFVANERSGLHTSDEAYKMAYTDAISVCCKMLGFGADVYWSAGRTKYTAEEIRLPFCEICGKVIMPFRGSDGVITSPEDWKKKSVDKYGKCVCKDCIREGKIDE